MLSALVECLGVSAEMSLNVSVKHSSAVGCLERRL